MAAVFDALDSVAVSLDNVAAVENALQFSLSRPIAYYSNSRFGKCFAEYQNLLLY